MGDELDGMELEKVYGEKRKNCIIAHQVVREKIAGGKVIFNVKLF